MKVIVTGASGMVGYGALRAVLRDADVTEVLVVGRRPLDTWPHDADRTKATELVFDMKDWDAIGDRFAGFDACMWCLGTSSAGMKEDAYRAVTYDLTLRAAKAMVRVAPQMTFMYVSGQGTDSSEKGGSMWARVKGKTENDLLALGFARAFMMRPGVIVPKSGARSKTKLYRAFYVVAKPLMFVLRPVLHKHMPSTDEIGEAMLALAKGASAGPIIDNTTIVGLAVGAH